MQNILDVIDLIEIVASDFEAANADGSINIFDIPKFADILPALNEAVEGADKIAAEIKALDEDGVKVVTDRLVKALMAIGHACGKENMVEPVALILQKGLDLVTLILRSWVYK